MDPQRWERVQTLFADALEVPIAKRQRFLAERCGDDDELFGLVTRMLRAHESTSQFLDAPNPKEPTQRRVEGPIGPFTVLEELGRGGMGVVVRARDPRLERDVALKLISTAAPTSARVLDRFMRESRAVARLRHRGIVPVHEVGEDHGYRWFSMDLLERGDLNRELDAQRGKSGRAPLLPVPGDPDHLPSVVRRMAQIADALEYAHGRGIVHRDIKPHNLLLDEEGRLCLVDFGLAKDESQGSVTQTGDLGGTPHYMSPEQAASDRTRIDHRTDVYSLGVVLYEMLTLQRPYRGDSAQEVITSIIKHDPPSLRRIDRDLPRELELVCSKAMARLPEDRYPSASEFADDLRRILAFKPVRAKPPSLARRIDRFVRRNRFAVAAAAVAVIAAVAALRVGTSFAKEERAVRDFGRVARMLDIADWTEVPFGDRMGLRMHLQTLGEDVDLLPSDARTGYQRLRRRFDAHEAELLDEAGRLVLLGATSRRGIESFDGELLFAGMRTFSEAAALFGDDVLEASPEHLALHPKVRVHAVDSEGQHLRGRAFARALDPLTGLPGAALPLGNLPVEAGRLEPGHYRVVVVPDEHEPREFTRVVRAGAPPVEVTCVVSEPTIAAQGMVRIDGDAVRFERHDLWSPILYEDLDIEIAPFWVDESLVSIGAYRAFLAEVGDAATPELWAELRDAEDPLWLEIAAGAYDDLPVTGLSLEKARAYAEFRGMRLLAQHEWDYLARGTDGRLRPYPEPDRYRGAGDGATPRPTEALDKARHFFSQVAPVRSHEEARSDPHGLYHLLGNVIEFTEALGFVELGDGSLAPDANTCIVVGEAWHSPIERKRNTSRRLRVRDASNASYDVGFRCARSVVP